MKGSDRDRMRALLRCEGQVQRCEAVPTLVVVWRKDVYDPYILGSQGYMDNSACDEHLGDLLAWVRSAWDGKAQLMTVDYYLYAWLEGEEAFSGAGLGKNNWH